MSGSLTISARGTPVRFKSMAVFEAASSKPSCRLFPASSSRCRRVMPIFFLPPLVILRDLVALRQVGIKIVFPRKDGNFVDTALQSHRRQSREFHSLLVQHG